MSSRPSVQIFQTTGEGLYLDGQPATLQTLTASVLKAAHEEDDLDMATLAQNLSKIVTARQMSDQFIDKWLSDGSLDKRPDSVRVYEFLLEDWCKAILGFVGMNEDYVQAKIGFQLESSLLNSAETKLDRCFEEMMGMVHHVYGDSLNASIRPDHSNPEHLIFRDPSTMCAVGELRAGGILTSQIQVTLAVYKREWWDPSEDEIRRIVREA